MKEEMITGHQALVYETISKRTVGWRLIPAKISGWMTGRKTHKKYQRYEWVFKQLYPGGQHWSKKERK